MAAITSSLAHASAQASSAVSLLFQNDGNWTNYANLPSALLFYDAVSFEEAVATCKANNEILLSSTSLKAFVLSLVRTQFTYLQYLKDATPTTKYWISTGDTTQTNFYSAPLNSSQVFQGSATEKLQFLCTNSAPHTTIVDTDFSASPRTTVTSDGVVYTGTRDHLTFRFMGIPYAEPPVGPLRFKNPQPWKGTEIDATFFKPVCLQFGFFDGNASGLMPWGNSEDCLRLHVFTPYVPSSQPSKSAPALKPVMFWIHGGGNTQGTGEDATFDGGSLVSRTDSVVVTVDHRLNIFGYLGLDETIRGNYAIADKVAALQWVHDNIAQFGGDPERVMIFGQSAGGSSVIELVRTPAAKGCFRLRSRSLAATARYGRIILLRQLQSVLPALNVYCNSTGAERLACLQALPADTVLNITNTVTTWMGVPDGVFPSKPGPSGVNSVSYMAGFMPEEGQSFIRRLLGTEIVPNMTVFDPGAVIGEPLGEKVLASGLWNVSDSFTPYNATVYAYTDWQLTCPAEEMIVAAAAAHTFPSCIYVYEMQRAYALSYFNPYNLCTFPVGDVEPPYYRCHSGDLYEVFGTYYIFAQPVRNIRDIQYTLLIQDMWASFARSGNPNPLPQHARRAEGFTWPEYSTDSPVVAHLQYPGIEEGTLPDIARCKVIDS
ncbi:carboxylesterase [Mycena galopus ATCC 62051]|nr:carboxylesterase [Mycena galopus ATCC 62051]